MGLTGCNPDASISKRVGVTGHTVGLHGSTTVVGHGLMRMQKMSGKNPESRLITQISLACCVEIFQGSVTQFP